MSLCPVHPAPAVAATHCGAHAVAHGERMPPDELNYDTDAILDPAAAPPPVFQPVLVGADIGVYALARSFHQAYGVRPVVVCFEALGPVARSSICDVVEVGRDASPQALLAALEGVAHRFTGTELLLVANTDWLIRLLVTHRTHLEQWYQVPVLGADLLAQLSDKVSFSELCTELGIATPRTLVQDFRAADDPVWVPQALDVRFPVIAKAANSADYERMSFPGKAKVYQVADAGELADLWGTLRAAGFRGRFVVQELIPGDDSQMRSITCYVDSRGQITLSCAAHVLLEEHTPSGLGNPAAMITGRSDELMASAHRLLLATGYTGFANFDVKVDPRDGTGYFLEVNPRIGRNNFYLTAAGANPVTFLVRDLIGGELVEPVVVDREVLYSIVPLRMLRRYVLDAGLRAKVEALIAARRTAHPLRYVAERDVRRRLYVALTAVSQWRKFRRWYPKVTATGL